MNRKKIAKRKKVSFKKTNINKLEEQNIQVEKDTNNSIIAIKNSENNKKYSDIKSNSSYINIDKNKIEKLINNNDYMSNVLGNIKTEKNTFEEKVADNLRQKTEIENINKKLNPNSIWNVISFGTIFNFIVFGTILGIILFFFGTIQPLILKNYTLNAIQKINNISDKYTEQVNGYFLLSKNLLEEFNYKNDALCSELELYNNQKNNLDSISRQKVALFSDKRYQTLDNFYYAKSTLINDKYIKVYNKYNSNLNYYLEKIKILEEIPNFLNYRNFWITVCQNIEKSPNNIAVLQVSCESLKEQTESYFNLYKPSFKTNIENILSDVLDNCGSLNKNNILNFKQSIITVYDKVINFVINFDELNQEFIIINKEFLDYKNKTIEEMIEYIDEKSLLKNNFYFLEYQF